MKKYILVSYFFATSLVAFSQKKIEYLEYDLANGIHVILHQETSTPIVAVSVLYHVGSKNENINEQILSISESDNSKNKGSRSNPSVNLSEFGNCSFL